MSSSEHYFSARPAGAEQRRQIDVTLRGRRVMVSTAPGVFSGDRVDLGTRVLLDAVPEPPASGELADVGCGWGPITLALAQAAPGARVWAADVNERAVQLTAANAAALGLRNVEALTADAALARLDAEHLQLDEIWSNPPIRIGKDALHALLRTWLGRLAPGGRAHLVVQRNLGADSLHRWLETELGMPTQRLASAKGYRVLTVRPAVSAD
ncbi:class I SAM-dependent methyltransferase [Georgenia faecalis]|uniref:Class I SAM-dependent methyltransferase n=1 Tax=Georgenia faecalis TaxID=2483799 RepID=A0ABV9DCG5_9MICO|nr:methyltransferase [Georgenia faecalis]